MVPSSDRSAASALVWFRRDLRDFDNAALHAALAVQRSVHCAFVFDTEILDGLERTDRRITFIWDSVHELQRSLEASGGGLHVLHGRARDEIPRLAAALGVEAVYANRDYEPQAIARDTEVAPEVRRDRLAYAQGPRDLRARRGAHSRRHTVLGFHTVQECVARANRAAASRLAHDAEPR